MKRWVPITAGALLLGAIVVISIVTSGPKGERVYVESVSKRDLEAIVSAPGEIDPKVKVNISSHVIGKIEKLYFKEGDLVKRGQRLVDLERVSYVAQRDRVNAELTNRHVDLRRAQLSLANARLQLDRAQQLRAQGIQAQEIFDKAKLDYDTAVENVDAAQSGIRQAQAALSQASQDLSYTSIDSPMDGRVVQLSAHEGEVVITGTMNNPGSVIAVLADLSEILVKADVTETDIVKVRVGQPARVKVDAIPDREYAARVVEIGSSAVTRATSPGVRYFEVKVALDTNDERLRPGMTAQVDVVTDTQRGVLSIPVQAVVERSKRALKEPKDDDSSDEDAKQKYVFVVKNDHAHAVQVKSGISTPTHVAILSGLQGSESVITGPFRTLKKLKDGESVKPEKERIESTEKE